MGNVSIDGGVEGCVSTISATTTPDFYQKVQAKEGRGHQRMEVLHAT